MKLRHQRIAATVLKFAMLLVTWSVTGNFWFASTLMILLLTTYKYVIAGLKNYDVLGIQDTLCLYDNERSVANVASKLSFIEIMNLKISFVAVMIFERLAFEDFR